jgi:hypothetical protein
MSQGEATVILLLAVVVLYWITRIVGRVITFVTELFRLPRVFFRTLRTSGVLQFLVTWVVAVILFGMLAW